MDYLFYARLVAFTAGTLVYLFLLALILGHRRPRKFERLLFFLLLGLFLIYAGNLLEANYGLQYRPWHHSSITRIIFEGLQALGVLLLVPLVWHVHYSYRTEISDPVRIPGSRPAYLGKPVLIAFYLIAGWMLATGVAIFLLYAYPGFGIGRGLFNALNSVTEFGEFLVPVLALCTAILELRDYRAAKASPERELFKSLCIASSLIGVFFIGYQFLRGLSYFQYDSLLTAGVIAGVLPGAILVYFSLRHNFLEFGAQRNLVYALSGTFLALLYLALVRRVSGWLEPVLPPEATASILLFVLIFLFEPLERVIGPALHRAHLERFGRVQKLAVELQQQARHGDVANLLAECERRIREEFGLAALRISVPRNRGLKPLEAPGGLGHAVRIPLLKDRNEIGLLEAATTGSYLTGETSAALEFLAEQLPAMIDLCRLIEEKLRLERELAERERMALLGQMAASVSHNLRNPLSSMKTVLQVQLENPELPLDMRRDCTLVVSEIDRMSAKLTQLLRFAKPSINGQRVAANTLARETAVLFRHDAERRNVRLEFEAASDEVYALGSEDALGEVLSNLIVNAIEAQPNGGRVRVGLARRGEQLQIHVEDDGPGISAEVRARIFQPFFTTKATGTGLGLSIVARRVAEMGGTLECESPVRNGVGTRFSLMLPIAK
ncbi:MAG: ATP-binding protein [Candidatus Acidiferrales bacterium]